MGNRSVASRIDLIDCCVWGICAEQSYRKTVSCGIIMPSLRLERNTEQTLYTRLS